MQIICIYVIIYLHPHKKDSPMLSKMLLSFLMCYTAILLTHIVGSPLNPMTVGGLAVGGVVAILAHQRHTYLPFVFIVIHMATETYVHTRHWWHYKEKEVLFYSVHTLFDIWFLWMETKDAKRRWIVLGSTLTVLLTIGWYYHIPAPKLLYPGIAMTHTHQKTALEAVVLGGVLGCALCHVWALIANPRKI